MFSGRPGRVFFFGCDASTAEHPCHGPKAWQSVTVPAELRVIPAKDEPPEEKDEKRREEKKRESEIVEEQEVSAIPDSASTKKPRKGPK